MAIAFLSAKRSKDPNRQLSNYSSLEGVLYCKPHFEQLFKETGSYNKNFQSPAKPVEKLTPELTRSPSKAASMFSGTQEKCATCGKTAYPLEKLDLAEAENRARARSDATKLQRIKVVEVSTSPSAAAKSIDALFRKSTRLLLAV